MTETVFVNSFHINSEVMYFSGVCKHAVAFVIWLHRQAEEPSPTSVSCYWKKSVLSTVKDSGTFLKVSQINPKPSVSS